MNRTILRNNILWGIAAFSIAVTCQGEDVPMDKLELRKKLTTLQYNVTQENGTEKPFENEYWDNMRPGIYVDIVSGEPLFSSLDKYTSGTGWPSFTRPLTKENIISKEDRSLFVKRIEVRSKKGDSHLGHVFNDGPKPTGLRYCINSASLRFIPAQDLEKEGYGEFRKFFNADETKTKIETATFAAGCFWGVEAILKEIPGVIESTVGYTGGDTENPDYRSVSTGRTGHAEAVQVKYDADKISYEQLLDYFWRLHDPTTLYRQGPDVGTQYRSAIFYYDEKQKRAAEKSKDAFDRSRIFPDKAVTQIVSAGDFYPAELYHQDYYEKNGGPVCHILRPE